MNLLYTIVIFVLVKNVQCFKNSPLKTIVTNKALSSSILENFSKSSIGDTLLGQVILMSGNPHDLNPLYFMIPVYIGLCMKNKTGNDKIERLELYRKRRVVFRQISFIMLAIFMKNIDVAV